jgi:stress response protein YsnF
MPATAERTAERIGTTMLDGAFNLHRSYIDFFTQTMLMPFSPADWLIATRKPVRSVKVDTARDEEIIAVGEEVLQIGKQIVGGDTTRVIRTVVESPVEEHVELITHTVVVERRQPNGTHAGGDTLSERTVAMTATQERPVVSKGLRVVEEVVLRREATAHVETVRATVKRDHIAIEEPNRLPAVIAQGRDNGRNDKSNNKSNEKSNHNVHV